MFLRSYVLLNQLHVSNLRLFRKKSFNASYLHNPGCEPLTYSNLGKVLEDTVNKYPNRVAIKSLHEELSISYEELLNQADSVGHALRNNGFQKGDRLGIWCHNCTGWIISVIAAARAGLISVLINPFYESQELIYCINKAEIKGLVFGNNISRRNYYGILQQFVRDLNNSQPGKVVSELCPTLTTLISVGNTDLNGAFKLNTLATKYKNNKISEYINEINPKDGSIIHFTSGTTGNPKASLGSHLGVVNNTYFTGLRSNLHKGHSKFCVQAPMFHALGSIVTVLGGLRHGSTLVLPSAIYSVQANINALCSEKCTAVTGTPTMYVDILSQIRNKGELPIKLNMAMAAGAPCSPQVIHHMKKHMNASVSALYGMTEVTAGVFQSLPDDSVDKVSETVGYIQDHVEAKVVDEDGNTVPFGESGELMIRGYVNMLSYWNDPEKTAQTVNDDGWLHTGDKFTISPDGYGTIVGRIKDIIVRGGENIAPKEIEDLLNTNPDIIESQVIGVADERLGEELCAVLRIREGAKIDVESIKSFCSGKIAKFKIPRILRIVDDFPKTISGKIQKFKLKVEIESGNIK